MSEIKKKVLKPEGQNNNQAINMFGRKLELTADSSG